MGSFLPAVWHGSHRTLRCPACGHAQSVARRPLPFEVTCRTCQRRWKITVRGLVPAGPGRPPGR